MNQEYLKKNIQNFKDKKNSLNRWNESLEYICNECGAELSPAIPRFFKDKYPDWIEKLLCYKCQQLTKGKNEI